MPHRILSSSIIVSYHLRTTNHNFTATRLGFLLSQFFYHNVAAMRLAFQHQFHCGQKIGQRLHALRLSLRDRSPHLIFLPSHPLLFVLHSQFSTSFFHSQLSVLNSQLFTLSSSLSWFLPSDPIPSLLSTG